MYWTTLAQPYKEASDWVLVLWISPLDLFALCVVTLLYLTSARWGFCLNTPISGMESISLIYLGLKSIELPLTLKGTGMVALIGATPS